ncbi:MAG TPA: phosphodiester glycosidase family protein [Pyrinomonadaceae bacterium]|jgi:exopolysaccharide biosynthesis protein
MKTIIYSAACRFFLFLFLFISFVLLVFPVCLSAQEFQTVQDGIEHAKFTRKIKDEPVVVNLLRLDLSKVRLDVVHAMDAAIGTETTSSMATRHGAIAAINAGFFRLDRSIFAGDAVGVLMTDGKVLSDSYGNRVALMINNFGRNPGVFITHFNYSQRISINGRSLDVTGINRERGENDLIIYTPEFHVTTLTNQNGIEIIVKGNEVIGQTALVEGGSKIPRFLETRVKRIPADGYVVSASGKYRQQLLEALTRVLPANSSPKIPVSINHQMNFPTLNTDERLKIAKDFLYYKNIVSGVPQLIKNGKIEITWEQEKSSKAFVETRHPRTAVAKLKDGKFLMVTVDGRQPGVSVGMNLNELAEMLLEFGATDAMNLDGGGSTTMFLGGKIVNQPSDKEGERKVSDAILVFPRKN